MEQSKASLQQHSMRSHLELFLRKALLSLNLSCD